MADGHSKSLALEKNDRRGFAAMKHLTVALAWTLATLGCAALLRWMDREG
jgi:hypothetical protein